MIGLISNLGGFFPKSLGEIKMRILVVLSAILALFLFLGCGEEDGDENGGDTNGTGEYQGFPEMKGGEWAEYTALDDGKIRYEYIGMDNISGHQCYLIEFEVEVFGEKVISQIWVDKETTETILYVTKQAGMVLKMDVTAIPTESNDVAEGTSGETPEEYSPGKEKSVETYKTPTGKEIKAAVFTENSDETWVSEEVPFGLVKVVSGGKVVLELFDFSFSGAKRDISKQEAETATSLPQFP
jgi:hypothetical protein